MNSVGMPTSLVAFWVLVRVSGTTPVTRPSAAVFVVTATSMVRCSLAPRSKQPGARLEV